MEYHANSFLSKWFSDEERTNYKIDTVGISFLSRGLKQAKFEAVKDVLDAANFGWLTMSLFPIWHTNRYSKTSTNLWFLGSMMSIAAPLFYERVKKHSSTILFVQRLEDEYDIVCAFDSALGLSDMTKVFEALDNWLPR